MPQLPSRRSALLALLLLAGAARAQSGGVAHTVTYIEVAPAAATQALALLRTHATAVRADPASQRFDLLQRMDRPHHFALVERWRVAAAADAHRASASVAAFRAGLAPMLIAPFDERPHATLSVGSVGDGPSAIVAVTHVDIIPPQREVGTAAVARLSEASRGAPGNLRFDALIQNSRPNHFTLVESWRDEASLLTHAAAAPTRAFREALLPMTGSLFDERLYRRAD